jgi:hypothetical protein
MGTLEEIDLKWMDCVKDDRRIKRMSIEMTSDKRKWKKKTCCAVHIVG